MSAKVLLGPNSSSMEIWPGVADVNREGVTLAHEILVLLEDNEDDEHGVALADYGCLEDWPREGRPFRNFVAEFLKAARERGPEVEAGFCAVLTDMIAMTCQGMAPVARRYANFGKKPAVRQ
jgi:hypothetical protein